MGGFGRGLTAGCLLLVPFRPNGLFRMTVAISSGESSSTGSGVYESRDGRRASSQRTRWVRLFWSECA